MIKNEGRPSSFKRTNTSISIASQVGNAKTNKKISFQEHQEGNIKNSDKTTLRLDELNVEKNSTRRDSEED